MRNSALVLVAGVLLMSGAESDIAQTINLSTSKQLIEPVPGNPQRLNSEPISMAVSPDGRYVVTVNAGYGTYESKYEQSLAVYDTQSGKVTDFPDDRTYSGRGNQTLYSGLAFSSDGSHLYASIGSETDPEGKNQPQQGPHDTGSGILVYRFADGRIEPDRMIRLPLETLPPGRKTKLIGEVDGDKGIPFPAAIAVVKSGDSEKLLVAENLTDDALLIDSTTGKIEHRFDLTESNAVPSTYPIALQLSKDGRRAYVALWNASEIVELNLEKNVVGRKLALLKPSDPVRPGTHPCAFALTADGKTMYVALANRDVVAAINVGAGLFTVKGYFDTRLPGQSYFGAEPVALALNASGSRLYVANMASDAVAVIDTKKLTASASHKGMVEPVGFVPTEWMPLSMAFLPGGSGGKLFVATDKGKGTVANPYPPKDEKPELGMPKRTNYIGTLLYGSLAVLNEGEMEQKLHEFTQTVLESNRMKAAAERIRFFDGSSNRIKHVIYIIKENRTYDQILGDLDQNGKPVANGDSSLTIYGKDVTPNLHKLALQFGVLDNFYDSGEVSGDGHVWSNAAIGTDYLEKTWQQAYRGNERTYDFEGVVADGLPLEQKIPDVNEPASGYMWTNLAKHGKTYYHFGEYIAEVFCDELRSDNPQEGPMLAGAKCAHKAIEPGEQIPAEWGGGTNKWPWPIPLIASAKPTKPELVGHFAPEAPDFNLAVPDQIRVEVFLRHFKQWQADRAKGKDTMPNFILLRIPDDHTNGTAPGKPTPKASVSDNDLAVGRAVEAISHSPYWDDTAFFILEDDAQNGADHVDAHRSIGLVISKYAPRGRDGAPVVDSRFYSTVSFIRTMETLLGLPPMNNNDAFSSMVSTLFTGPGDQPAYSADYTNRDNGLIYTANPKHAPGSQESLKMDFRHADQADAQKLNVVLWKDAMTGRAVPAMLTQKRAKARKDDDD